MVRQKLSMKDTAIARRIKNLPKMATDMIEMVAKGQAQALRSEFHDGIKENKFGLQPLKEATMDRKEAMGFDIPENPLYGLGDSAEDSYANMLEVFKDEGKKKYIVKPRDEYHQVQAKDGSIVASKFKLKDLFTVHEYGCTISNGFGMGILIRIPPRPALRYAHDIILKRLKDRDPAKEVRSAINKYLKTNSKKAMELIAARDWASEITGSPSEAEKRAQRRDK